MCHVILYFSEIWPTAVSPNATTGNDTIDVTDTFESSGVTNTAIIIAVSGSCVVIFIVIVLLLVICMYTRRKKKTNKQVVCTYICILSKYLKAFACSYPLLTT